MPKLILSGTIVPKARPRFWKKGDRVLTPLRYRNWKKQAIAKLTLQWREPPVEKFKLSIVFGAIGQRGDLDNLAGAVLDALVQARVIKDDRLSCCAELNIKFVSTKAGVNVIEIEAIDRVVVKP